jgi:hypothetical protein
MAVFVRSIPDIDSDEPIRSFRELAAAHRASARTKGRNPSA